LTVPPKDADAVDQVEREPNYWRQEAAGALCWSSGQPSTEPVRMLGLARLLNRGTLTSNASPAFLDLRMTVYPSLLHLLVRRDEVIGSDGELFFTGFKRQCGNLR
jgi:hypothetical protein